MLGRSLEWHYILIIFVNIALGPFIKENSSSLCEPSKKLSLPPIKTPPEQWEKDSYNFLNYTVDRTRTKGVFIARKNYHFISRGLTSPRERKTSERDLFILESNLFNRAECVIKEITSDIVTKKPIPKWRNRM